MQSKRVKRKNIFLELGVHVVTDGWLVSTLFEKNTTSRHRADAAVSLDFLSSQESIRNRAEVKQTLASITKASASVSTQISKLGS